MGSQRGFLLAEVAGGKPDAGAQARREPGGRLGAEVEAGEGGAEAAAGRHVEVEGLHAHAKRLAHPRFDRAPGRERAPVEADRRVKQEEAVRGIENPRVAEVHGNGEGGWAVNP
ncbi:hypothetical protein D3C72_2008050 [compost metagenome]